jgi:hypothetical protein
MNSLLSPPEVMDLISSFESALGPPLVGQNANPTLEEAKELVQAELRGILEYRDASTRALASWSWLAIIEIVAS